MIDISNLRIEQDGEWAKLVVEITSDFQRKDSYDTMWIAVKNKNAHMLTTDSYNAFLLYPLYMAMYYKSDLHLHGQVSKTLYNNVNSYLQSILTSFSDELHRVNVIVDGFGEVEGNHDIVGTGISGGVDSLSTIYAHYVKETDPKKKINGLFMLNWGWHGEPDDPAARIFYEERWADMRATADDIGLPFYEVDSNVGSFLRLGDKNSYFKIYSCIFALEKAIGKYYISSSLSYQEILKWNWSSRDRDWSEYADPYAIPLLRSERLELISDGCQYKRTEKTELISNWSVARKHLNVCCKNDSSKNCSVCHKCLRTLMPLEAMGKLDYFSDVFNIEAYKKVAFESKCKLAIQSERDPFARDNIQYCRMKELKIPSKIAARVYMFPKFLPGYIRKLILGGVIEKSESRNE